MIFVFGSNKAGIHGAGAAKHAFNFLAAEWGVGEGMTGGCYALPTKGFEIEDLPLEELQRPIADFCSYAREHPHLSFELTPVGCGLAGHKKSDIWGLFKANGLPSNVYLSSTWVTDN